MQKFIIVFLVISILFSANLPAIAVPGPGDIYQYEDQKQLTPQEVNLWKYKMGRITIRNELGKWHIIEGINTELTDLQLLKLVNSENIAVERLKGIEFKQNIGSVFVIGGILLGIVGGVLVSNIIKVENGLYYGIGGLAGGLGLIVVGNAISPLIVDEADHIINIEEARNAAEKYNAQLRKTLKLPDDIE